MITSEQIEPLLTHVLGRAIRELGSMPKPPGIAWYRDLALRLEGITWLISAGRQKGRDPNLLHADLAWSNTTHEWARAGGRLRWMDAHSDTLRKHGQKREKEARVRLWECSREAVESAGTPIATLTES